jgi:hypothetical protein
MGYKDDRWLEAPGYCVECGNLRPLDKSAVCEECRSDLSAVLCEDWIEDEYFSQWYYKRSGKSISTSEEPARQVNNTETDP